VVTSFLEDLLASPSEVVIGIGLLTYVCRDECVNVVNFYICNVFSKKKGRHNNLPLSILH
jgi:hypothetical protein